MTHEMIFTEEKISSKLSENIKKIPDRFRRSDMQINIRRKHMDDL